MSVELVYYGQVGQDRFVNERVFNHKENGFFVEVGASNGVRLSNTLFFEESMAWDGICIEPNPSVYQDLCLNRECITYGCAIDVEEGEVGFTKNVGYTEQLSGITKYYHPSQISRMSDWFDGNADDDSWVTRLYGEASCAGLPEGSTGGYIPNSGSSEEIRVKSRRLDSIFRECQVTEVDYISIDVEGAELPVVQSINYDEVMVHVIGFEANWSDSTAPVVEYLSQNGFVHLANVGHDVFMINENSEYKR